METITSPADDQTVELRQIVAGIASKVFGIDTLEIRNSDSLDFYDLSVSNIERALIAAYEAGRQSKVDGVSK